MAQTNKINTTMPEPETAEFKWNAMEFNLNKLPVDQYADTEFKTEIETKLDSSVDSGTY